MSFIGTIFGAQSQAAQYKQQAAIMKTQAAISRLEQTQASLQSAYEERKFQEEKSLLRERVRNLVSKQRAGFAASGAMLKGSPLIVMAESLTNAERDIAMLEMDKKAKRLGLDISAFLKGAESSIYLSSAKMQKRAGKSALTSGYLTAGGQFLEFGAKAVGAYSMLSGGIGSAASTPSSNFNFIYG